MPKLVDHAQRRDEIALVACRVVAEHGFDQASMVRIAREAGYTTGMLAHYFESKQEIIIAALRLILRRIDERLTRAAGSNTRPELLALLTEALPLDEQRHTECAFWTSFWGQITADRRMKRINSWVHHEYLRLFERCLAQSWAQWAQWPQVTREQVLRSLVTFINGLTASAVANPGDWPPQKQLTQMRLQLRLLHGWATGAAAAGGEPLRTSACTAESS
jgi:TetR/AcrR family transcriptional regulator, transcriptional repressor of bet genes